MKALAIDSAASCMIVSAKNDEISFTVSIDLGMKQSQKILPAIDYVLKEVNLSIADLDYLTLCSGPGTFTGLRLAFSALKAIELSANIPLYGIPSLDVYAYPYSLLQGIVVSVIDAKKNQFFASIFKNGKNIKEAEDTTAENVIHFLETMNLSKEIPIYIVGPDAEIFATELKNTNQNLNIVFLKSQPSPEKALFELTEKMIENNAPSLNDYDGPIYLRKSEAELALKN
ncbi:tRNA (adenosine(37)-N6)-threonylcarbamoyltransferase complex dimerization subunit type 1 TsaB [Treponema zioleckii]|uniref:tRNA (adenosine(37)-N6)-threonylcarbamoyltransferase complex dimerization subunit type 1 TsaB n=1 Tax=Treponema zioleckii TaxID=331680 RepID=UPI00168A5AD1|nr:tRNA (adenosine(37)-N6)-threonylcarbamoyltransferase complex dimerization subunit type 1 TsaB [Treponema zioleckii]